MAKYLEYMKWKNSIENDTANNYLIINLATSGLPKKKNGFYAPYSKSAYYDTSRLVQIVWGVYNDKGVEVVKKKYTILPDKFEIPKETSNIHGITNNIATKDGTGIALVMNELVQDVMSCKYMVSHNIEFDYNVLMSELYRYKLKDLLFIVKYLDKVCTGESTKNLLKLKTKVGYTQYKMPKLSELYKYCFKKNIGPFDVEKNFDAIVKIFFFLKKKFKMSKKE